MGKYLLKRTFTYLVMLFIAVTLAYFLCAAFLDPRLLYPIENPDFNWQALNQSLDAKNLNPSEPILSRYWDWLSGVIHWDWGQKPKSGLVNEEISNRVWVSVRLVTGGFLIGAIGGIVVGAWTATRQYKVSDRTITLGSLVLLSTPTFVIGKVLQILTIKMNRAFGWDFQIQGEIDVSMRDAAFFPRLLDRLQHLVLPTIALALITFALYSRYQRNMMLDTLHADYVRTARAKGLSRRKAVFKHALRTALIPVGTLFAFSLAGVFVGATFTERIFSFRGMGDYLVTSIQGQDVNGAVAVAAFSGVTVFVGAILSEIFVVLLDPRVRVG